MSDREEFVDQLLSSLPIDEYCLRIVKENEKFSKLSSKEKGEAIQEYKKKEKYINFQNAIKKQWGKYFLSAYDCGLFKPKYKVEILNRIVGLGNELQKNQTEQFRGALAGCCACYVLDEIFGFKVIPHMIIKNKKSYDFDVFKNCIHLKIEVKAPEREMNTPPGQTFCGDDSEQLHARVVGANNQGANLICIVFNLTTQIGKHVIFGDRKRLANAICKNYQYPEFLPEFSNIKAILSIEQKLEFIGDGKYDHSLDILLMENPRYYDEIAPIVYPECVHLIKKEDEWIWSDGEIYGFKLGTNKR